MFSQSYPYIAVQKSTGEYIRIIEDPIFNVLFKLSEDGNKTEIKTDDIDSVMVFEHGQLKIIRDATEFKSWSYEKSRAEEQEKIEVKGDIKAWAEMLEKMLN